MTTHDDYDEFVDTLTLAKSGAMAMKYLSLHPEYFKDYYVEFYSPAGKPKEYYCASDYMNAAYIEYANKIVMRAKELAGDDMKKAKLVYEPE